MFKNTDQTSNTFLDCKIENCLNYVSNNIHKVADPWSSWRHWLPFRIYYFKKRVRGRETVYSYTKRRERKLHCSRTSLYLYRRCTRVQNPGEGIVCFWPLSCGRAPLKEGGVGPPFGLYLHFFNNFFENFPWRVLFLSTLLTLYPLTPLSPSPPCVDLRSVRREK